MIALELLGAISAANFPKFEMMVLANIFAAQYGPGKLEGASISPIELAEALSCHPSNFRKALKNLVACSVIVDNGFSFYSFNKDWESWSWKPIDAKGDTLSARIGPGDRPFIAFLASHFGPKNRSTKRRKPGATQPQQTLVIGADQPQHCPTPRADRPHIDVDANHMASDAKPLPVSTLDAPLAGTRARASEDLRIERRRGEILSTESPPNSGAGVSIEDQLDSLRNQVAALMNDDNLALVFRDQVVDWMNCGMLVEDVREAILIASTKGIDPRSFVPFVSSASRRIRNDRQSGKRPTLSIPAGSPGFQPPAKKSQYSANLDRQRAALAAMSHAPKEETNGLG